MKTGCRVKGCNSTDDNGILEVGSYRFHICKKHVDMVNGEDQIGLVKRAHIRIGKKGELEIFHDEKTSQTDRV